MLLGTDNEGKTVWFVVIKRGILSSFRNYGIGPKNTAGEKFHIFLFGTDDKGRTAWIVVA